MALSVQVTVSMPFEMVEEIDEQAELHDMNSRAEYVRHLIQQAEDSPFDVPETVLCRDENGSVKESETGAA